MTLDPRDVCHCPSTPLPMYYLGEEVGICLLCRGIYDERLYYMRLRQHVAGFTYDSVGEYLRAADPVGWRWRPENRLLSPDPRSS
jgi:hypothetical protein